MAIIICRWHGDEIKTGGRSQYRAKPYKRRNKRFSSKQYSYHPLSQDDLRKRKNLRVIILISIVIITILIVMGSYIIIDVFLKGEEEVGNVIVSITNNRDHDVLVRLEIDYKDSYIGTLSSMQTVNRLYRLSEGTHTFNLFVDGSFYSTYDRIIESDQDELEPVEFIIL